MLKRVLLAVLLGPLCGVNCAARPAASATGLEGSPIYSDPGFQDFIETTYGYLNPRYKPLYAEGFRDALSAGTPERKKAAVKPVKKTKYVFVSIMPKLKDYTALVRQLSVSAGFVLSGERTVYAKKVKKTLILGWAKAGRLGAIRKNSGVAAVRLERGRKKDGASG